MILDKIVHATENVPVLGLGRYALIAIKCDITGVNIARFAIDAQVNLIAADSEGNFLSGCAVGQHIHDISRPPIGSLRYNTSQIIAPVVEPMFFYGKIITGLNMLFEVVGDIGVPESPIGNVRVTYIEL